MRGSLVVALGVPGSGKSTFLRENGLDKYAISSDQIRLLLSAPLQTEEGEEGISNKKDRMVWQLLNNAVEDRLKNGEFTIIDATHTKASYWQKYIDLSKQYNVDVYCLDFREVTKETAYKQNKQRDSYKIVNEEVIDRMYNQLNSLKLPKGVKVIKPEDWDEWSDITYKNLNEYKKIHHFGDIHGCYEPLGRYFKDGLKEDEFYIFVGDYIDRGLQNAEVLEFLFTIKDRKNVVLLEGNHEAHLRKWIENKTSNSKEFNRYTKLELEKNNVSVKKVRSLCHKLVNHFTYEYNDKKVIVSHGGIVKCPKKIYELSSEQLIKGVGTYTFDVDAAFCEKNDEGYVQVHGHRNLLGKELMEHTQSFNLEGKIDKGGHLRVLTLDKDGFTGFKVKNNRYSPRFQKGEFKNFGNQQLLEELRSNKGIKESKQKDNISSFNFTKAVFRKKEWDQTRVKTRGLFINTETTEIVIKSYNKFFNVGEREETGWESLKNTLQFPVTTYLKENGFLGLVGYDSLENKVIIASKSQTNGTYKTYFENIWLKKIGPEKEESVKRLLKERNITLVFEVIDPINDPHIIEYKKENIILLDAVYRQQEFKKIEYEELLQIGKELGVKVKKKTGTFFSFDELYQWVERESVHENKIEGHIIEDSNGFQTKLKLPYYNYWKWARSQIHSLYVRGTMNREFLEHPLSKGYKVTDTFPQVIEHNPEWVTKGDMPNIVKFLGKILEN